MGSETRRLDEICSLIVDCPHSTPVWTDSGFIVLRNQNIKNGKLDLSSPSYTDEEHFIGRNRRAKPSVGDIVITREAPMGDVCMIPDGLECCLGQRQVLLRPDPKFAVSRYVLYALQSQSVQRQIGWNEGTGSTVSNLRIPILQALDIPMPPIEEQRAIAHILGTLDDKVELNCKQNKTLEAIARALFKAWFVDFEPVRAKQEGRWQRGQSLPGLPAHLYDLFPDCLVDSELGEVPKGWGVGGFSNVIEIIGGGTPKTSVSEYWGGDIPWFSVVDTPASSDVFVVSTEKSITEAGLNGSSARLIKRGTTVISARGTVGNLAMAGCDMTFNQSCYALRGKNGSGSYFVFLSAQRMVEQLKAMAHGSVFSTITRQTFDAVRVVLPPENVLQQFEKSVASVLDAILGNVNESRSLAELRDTLLPQLISGELRVSDAERIVGA
ncbi:restriction endonuclease subunit S [Celeribacter sp.]|uniref:restriction endonuclease subunit S n=1 Tax=Celeribacter sp. TaxID=1890673 RepID=UPI003A8E1519